MTGKDMLGNDLTPTEKELLEIYRRLKTLVAREDLTPCVRSNLRFATATFARAKSCDALSFAALSSASAPETVSSSAGTALSARIVMWPLSMRRMPPLITNGETRCRKSAAG